MVIRVIYVIAVVTGFSSISRIPKREPYIGGFLPSLEALLSIRGEALNARIIKLRFIITYNIIYSSLDIMYILYIWLTVVSLIYY